MILTIESENKDLSFVLRKNPASPLLARKIINGTAVAGYVNDQKYMMYFKDVDKASYGDSKYVNVEAFSNPNIVMKLLNEFTRDAYMKDAPEDKACFNKVTISAFSGQRSVIKTLDKHIENIEFKFEGERLIIQGTSTLKELLNYVMLTAFLVDEEYKNSDQIAKYASMIAELNLPYFIRYIYKRNCLFNDQNLFNKVGENLNSDGIVILNGDNGWQRKKFISSLIDEGSNILDVGCGEGVYICECHKKAKTYTAIDIDEYVLDRAVRKYGEIPNVEFLSSIDEFEQKEPVTIILTEVIEHMSKEEGIELLQKLMKLDFDKMIVTTPNVHFNEFYMIPEGVFRHPDHKWEGDLNEFIQLLNDAGITKFEQVEFGDSVNGIHATNCLIVHK